MGADQLHPTSWLTTLIAFIPVGLAVWRYYTTPDAALLWHPMSLVAILLLVLFLYLIRRYSLYRRFRENTALHRLRAIEITPQGFTLHTDRPPITCLWKDFSKFRRGRRVTLVYRMDDLFQIFPRRWFTDDQHAEFQSLLRTAFKSPT